jgi:hypothetical protein
VANLSVAPLAVAQPAQAVDTLKDLMLLLLDAQ